MNGICTLLTRSRPCALLATLLTAACWAVAGARAEPSVIPDDEDLLRPDGVHVMDGSFVLNVGELHVNITNHGLIGSQFTLTRPFSHAASGQWPGGSGDEYLWGAGLWVGARLNGELLVTTGQVDREWRPTDDLRDTIYESIHQTVQRPYPAAVPAGRRLPDWRADDDGDGALDEDPLDGQDNDGDGAVDEDYGQFGDQMFVCTMRDDLPLTREIYPEHQPLGLSVRQRAATWYEDDYDDIVALDFEITNQGYRTLEDVYLGFYVDCDIQRRGDGVGQPDDRAGFWSGTVRASDGAFSHLQVAYMYDSAEIDPLPGYFGVVLLEHTLDFAGRVAPQRVDVRTFQIFSTNADVYQDGEPTTDAGRYEVMSQTRIDGDSPLDRAGDLKFLVSSGPFPLLKPGKTVNYRLGLVIGDGLDEMLSVAQRAVELARGHYYDLDPDPLSGINGRETKICLGDLDPIVAGEEPLYYYRIDFTDNLCVGEEPLFGYSLIGYGDMQLDEDGRFCVYVNTDNCDECFRAMGQECTPENNLFFEFLMDRVCQRRPWVCSGVYGRETRVPWDYYGELAPVAPASRLVAGDNQVELFWDDRSEFDPDPLRGVIDFESYRIWRVAEYVRVEGTAEGTRPAADQWALLAEYDLPNAVPAGVGDSPNETSLGANTGLEIARYSPPCLTDARFSGLADAMQGVVDANPARQLNVRPALRGPDGRVLPGLEPLVPWEGWPAVLDTFFAVTAAEPSAANQFAGKRASRFYHYLDREVHNGFPTLYAVVASDHRLAWRDGGYVPAGPGIQEDPGNNALWATPTPPAQTADRRRREGTNIYVYPNPATRDALAEFAQQPPAKDDPTGARVMFNNLPAALNTITIYTAAGDLVQTFEHDGRGGVGSASWSLVSRNGQEVVSGIYLYVVQSAGGGFDDFRGRFVLVR